LVVAGSDVIDDVIFISRESRIRAVAIPIYPLRTLKKDGQLDSLRVIESTERLSRAEGLLDAGGGASSVPEHGERKWLQERAASNTLPARPSP
jgi:hypothetical protein